MVITVTDTVKEQLIKLSGFAVCLLMFFPSWAGDWRVTPKISAEEIYTDNVELFANDDTESLVSLVSPGLTIEFQAPRVYFNVDYAKIQAWYSHNHDLDDNYDTLAANASFQLFPEGLSLNLSASIRNVTQSDAQNSLADLVSSDTVEYNNYQAGLAYNIASSSFTIDTQISFVLDESEDDVGEREGYDASIASESGNNSRMIFWNINGQYNDYENNNRKGRYHTAEIIAGYITNWSLNPYFRFYDEDTSGNLEDNQIQGTSSVGAGLRWQVSNHLIIDVAHNKVDEEKNANDTDLDEQKDYTSAALRWQPSVRTDLYAKYYKRFYGDAYHLTFNHQSKRLTTTISYDESLNVFDRLEVVPVNIQDVWCLTTAPNDIGNCIFSPDDTVDLSPYSFVGITSEFEVQQANSFSLNKSFNFNSQLALKRLTVELGLRQQKRENIELSDEDKYDFASLSITRLTSRTSQLNIRLSLNKNTLDNSNSQIFGQKDYYRIYKINWTENLNQNFDVIYSLQHLNRSSNILGYSYEENRASIKLIKEF